MKYVPALDGLRAVAVLAVLAFHSGAPFAGTGYIGVDLFFVLSGYLITSILRSDYQVNGGIDVIGFYIRRAIRLYPTLLLMLIGFIAVAPYLWPELPAWRYAAWAGFYLSDYSRAFLGEPIVLSYTWSLSVEEHFYLLWPLLIPLVIRSNNPVGILIAAYVMSTLWRVGNYLWLGWEPTYFRFDTRTSGLILGCLLAFWKPDVTHRSTMALLLLACMFPLTSFHNRVGLTAITTLAELCSAVLIVATTSGATKLKWLEVPWLTYLGRLSYGIYIWHFPAVYWLRDHYSWWISLAASGTFAVMMAAITYHVVDVPLKAERRRRVASAIS